MDEKSYFFEEEEEILEEIPDELPGFEDDTFENDDLEEIEVDVKTSRIEKPIDSRDLKKDIDIIENNSETSKITKKANQKNLLDLDNDSSIDIVEEPVVKQQVVDRISQSAKKSKKEVFFFDSVSNSADLAKLNGIDIIANMEKQFNLQSKYDELHKIESKIEEKISPLPTLENEWRLLKKELAEKQRLLEEKESMIKQLTADVKELSISRDKLKKELK